MIRRTRRAALITAAAVAALGGVALAAPATISTVAGTGTAGFTGDDGPATLAQLSQPRDLARLPNGDVLVADSANNRIRRIDQNGTITTYAGAGGGDVPACGSPRLGMALSAPEGVDVTPAGNVVIANTGGANVVEVDAASGTVTRLITGTVVGGGPADVAAQSDGSYLVADRPGRRIVRVAPSPGCGSPGGTPTTLAGNGLAGASGDGGPATSAAIGVPESVSPISANDFLLADSENGRVRRVTAGTITSPATGLVTPTGVTSTGGGAFLVAEQGGNRVRRLAIGGALTTAAGDGVGGALAGPADALPTSGGFLVAERGGNQVRRVLDATADPVTPVRQLPVLAPVIRRTAVLERVRGIVAVRPRGRKGFVRLTGPALIRVGSEIDVERGVARVTVASDTRGTLAPATVRGGRFVLSQGRGSRPITAMALSRKLTCPKAKRKKRARRGRASAAAKRRKSRKSRRLWVQTRAKRYRTKGRYATGTVRGTRWLTTDGCRSTRIAVTRGVVTVRDLVRKRNRAVRPGRSYTARARKR